MSKKALVLAGGGISGAMYEIGCLAALDDFSGGRFTANDFDIYLGSSAGSVVASLLANGIRPGQIREAILENREDPLNFKLRDIYCPCVKEVVRFGWRALKSVPSALRHYWRHRRQVTWVDSLHGLLERLPPGFFKLDRLEGLLEAILTSDGRSNDFRTLKRELYVAAADIDTGQRILFGEVPFTHVPISKAVAASCAIPVLFEPVHIEGHDLVDGAVASVAHLDVALRKGAEEILVINPVSPVVNDGRRVCFRTSDGRCGRMRDLGIPFIADQAARIGTRFRLEMGIERFRAEFPKVQIWLISPDPWETTMFTQGYLSYASRATIIEYAYHSTAQKLNKQAEPIDRFHASRPSGVQDSKLGLVEEGRDAPTLLSATSTGRR